MTGNAARRRKVWAGAAAEAAGRLLRSGRGVVRTLPGAVGAVLVSVGLGQVYPPLLLISAGGWLLLVDWRSR